MQRGTMNDIDVDALEAFAQEVLADPTAGQVSFAVSTTWEGGTKTRAITRPILLGGSSLPRSFAIPADEPEELLGTNSAPNPQELLLAALNACVTVGYAATAASMGIELRALRIHTEGRLDLRGFLGLDAAVNPGYDELSMRVEVDSDAGSSLLQELHARVKATSPNYANLSRAVLIASSIEACAK